MKTCSDFEMLAARAMCEELSPGEAAALARHVAGCVSCSDFQRSVEEDDRRLSVFAVPLTGAADRVTAATLERMQHRGAASHDRKVVAGLRRWHRYVPAAAA